MILVHNDLTKDPTSRNFVDIEVHTQLHLATRVINYGNTFHIRDVDGSVTPKLIVQALQIHFQSISRAKKHSYSV